MYFCSSMFLICLTGCIFAFCLLLREWFGDVMAIVWFYMLFYVYHYYLGIVCMFDV